MTKEEIVFNFIEWTRQTAINYDTPYDDIQQAVKEFLINIEY